MKNYLSKPLEKHAFCQARVFRAGHAKHRSLMPTEVEPDLPIRRIVGQAIQSAGMDTCPTEVFVDPTKFVGRTCAASEISQSVFWKGSTAGAVDPGVMEKKYSGVKFEHFTPLTIILRFFSDL